MSGYWSKEARDLSEEPKQAIAREKKYMEDLEIEIKSNARLTEMMTKSSRERMRKILWLMEQATKGVAIDDGIMCLESERRQIEAALELNKKLAEMLSGIVEFKRASIVRLEKEIQTKTEP